MTSSVFGSGDGAVTTGSQLTLLIVDDQPSFRKTMRDMLRRAGFAKIVTADDGDTALQILRTKPIDLVLCDWNMPRMNGVQLLRVIRDDPMLREKPFIMITGEAEQGTVAEAIEDEVDAYLLKPLSVDILREKIWRIFERRERPAALDTHIQVGQVYLKGRQYDKAIAEFSQAMAANPDNVRPMAAMGEVYEQKGDLDLAKEWYLKAVTLAPKYIRAHDALARLAQAQGDHVALIKHLKAAVSLSPKKVDRQMALGRALLAAQQRDDARLAFKKALKAAREYPALVAREVGEAWLEADEPGWAQEAFLEGLSSNPEDIPLYNRLGIAYRKQGKYQEAVDNYQQALAIDPDNEVLHYNLGRAQAEAGQVDQAIGSMKKALAIAPHFEDALKYFTQVLKQPLPRK